MSSILVAAILLCQSPLLPQEISAAQLSGPVYWDATPSVTTSATKAFINATITSNCQTSGKYAITVEKPGQSVGDAFEVDFSYVGNKSANGYVIVRNEASTDAPDFIVLGLDCLK